MAHYQIMRDRAIESGRGFAGLRYETPSGISYIIWELAHRLSQRAGQVGILATLEDDPSYILAFDVSHWNGDLTDEFWAAAYAAGYRAVIIKATEGISYLDPQFKINVARAKAAGFLVLAYHYSRPRFGGTAQARWFLENVVPLDVASGMYDLEEDDGLEGAAVNDDAETFMEPVRLQYGHVLFYSAAWFMDRRPGINPQVNYLRVPAHWNLYVSHPYMPAIWRADGRWDAWQYWYKGTISGRSPFDLIRMQPAVYKMLSESDVPPAEIDLAALRTLAAQSHLQLMEVIDKIEAMQELLG